MNENANPSKVYFIRDATGRVKIGKSFDVGKRLAQMQTGSADDLEIVRVIDGDFEEESWLHDRFHDLHIRGEWFWFHEDMLTVSPPPLQRRLDKPIHVNLDSLSSLARQRRLIGGEGYSVFCFMIGASKFSGEFERLDRTLMAEKLQMHRSNLSRAIRRLVSIGALVAEGSPRAFKAFKISPDVARRCTKREAAAMGASGRWMKLDSIFQEVPA
jgi:hypothetical protein